MKVKYLIIGVFLITLSSCSQEDESHYTPVVVEPSTNATDIYIKNNIMDPYNSRVVWKWQNQLINYSSYVTPPQERVVIPAVDMLKTYWINPYEKAENGKEFLKTYFPPEFVFIGSPLYNGDGTVTLGVAEAGMRITLTELDYFSATSRAFVLRQMHTVHHEYTHIIHQQNKLPEGYKDVNPKFTGSEWINIKDDGKECVKLGMVTPYGTSSENEDFAELVSTYLTTSESDFNTAFITPQTCTGTTAEIEACNELNTGKAFVATKLAMTKEYYKNKFKLDIDEVRDEVVSQILANTK